MVYIALNFLSIFPLDHSILFKTIPWRTASILFILIRVISLISLSSKLIDFFVIISKCGECILRRRSVNKCRLTHTVRTEKTLSLHSKFVIRLLLSEWNYKIRVIHAINHSTKIIKDRDILLLYCLYFMIKTKLILMIQDDYFKFDHYFRYLFILISDQISNFFWEIDK